MFGLQSFDFLVVEFEFLAGRFQWHSGRHARPFNLPEARPNFGSSPFMMRKLPAGKSGSTTKSCPENVTLRLPYRGRFASALTGSGLVPIERVARLVGRLVLSRSHLPKRQSRWPKVAKAVIMDTESFTTLHKSGWMKCFRIFSFESIYICEPKVAASQPQPWTLESIRSAQLVNSNARPSAMLIGDR